MPPLLCHGSSDYNSNLRRPVTLISNAERLAVELSLLFNDLSLSRMGFEHPTFRLRGKRSNYIATVIVNWIVQSVLIGFHIFSNLSDSQHEGLCTSTINEWTGMKVLRCMEKLVLTRWIPAQAWLKTLQFNIKYDGFLLLEYIQCI